jgi:hypothetical protein
VLAAAVCHYVAILLAVESNWLLNDSLVLFFKLNYLYLFLRLICCAFK